VSGCEKDDQQAMYQIKNMHCPFLNTYHSVFQSGMLPCRGEFYFVDSLEEKKYFVSDFINGGELFFHLSNEKRFSVGMCFLSFFFFFFFFFFLILGLSIFQIARDSMRRKSSLLSSIYTKTAFYYVISNLKTFSFLRKVGVEIITFRYII
jgi:hypothetical protein